MYEHLSPDELLTTTRSVRKRLDFSRPVEREVIQECLAIAQQAPAASNLQNWHFVVVTDPSRRAALAEIYRKGWETYLSQPLWLRFIARAGRLTCPFPPPLETYGSTTRSGWPPKPVCRSRPNTSQTTCRMRRFM
jgi:nitroreductase